jgi:hypothetical protein
MIYDKKQPDGSVHQGFVDDTKSNKTSLGHKNMVTSLLKSKIIGYKA